MDVYSAEPSTAAKLDGRNKPAVPWDGLKPSTIAHFNRPASPNTLLVQALANPAALSHVHLTCIDVKQLAHWCIECLNVHAGRTAWSIDDTGQFSIVELRIKWKDTFVIYLNGFATPGMCSPVGSLYFECPGKWSGII